MQEQTPRSPVLRAAVVAADRRVRDSLASLLVATGRVELMAAASDWPAVLEATRGQRPDLLIVDPGTTGGRDRARLDELCRREPGVLVLAVEWERGTLGLTTGAGGVVDTGSLPAPILEVLASAGSGTD
jgi:DNA-binding NarL/FixJ family response regulator